MLHIRVFTSGAEELRPDSAELGSAAYTAQNVPSRFAGQGWVVDMRPEPSIPGTESAVMLNGRLGGQRVHGGTGPLDKLVLSGNHVPGAASEVVIDDVLNLSGDGIALVAVEGEATQGAGGAAGVFSVRVGRDGGAIRKIRYYA
jgi:hypothetical protein